MRSITTLQQIKGRSAKHLIFISAIFVALCFSLTACGSNESNNEDNTPPKEEAEAEEEETVIEVDVTGTYTAIQDLTTQLNTSLENSGSPIHLNGKVEGEFVLELRDDETFLMSANPEKIQDELERVLREDRDSVVDALLEDAGITEDQYDAIVEEGNYESIDAFKDEILEKTVTAIKEGISDSISEGSRVEGTYRTQDKNIYLEAESDEGTVTLNGVIDENEGITIINDDGSELKFTKS